MIELATPLPNSAAGAGSSVSPKASLLDALFTSVFQGLAVAEHVATAPPQPLSHPVTGVPIKPTRPHASLVEPLAIGAAPDDEAGLSLPPSNGDAAHWGGQEWSLIQLPQPAPIPLAVGAAPDDGAGKPLAPSDGHASLAKSQAQTVPWLSPRAPIPLAISAAPDVEAGPSLPPSDGDAAPAEGQAPTVPWLSPPAPMPLAISTASDDKAGKSLAPSDGDASLAKSQAPTVPWLSPPVPMPLAISTAPDDEADLSPPPSDGGELPAEGQEPTAPRSLAPIRQTPEPSDRLADHAELQGRSPDKSASDVLPDLSSPPDDLGAPPADKAVTDRQTPGSTIDTTVRPRSDDAFKLAVPRSDDQNRPSSIETITSAKLNHQSTETTNPANEQPLAAVKAEQQAKAPPLLTPVALASNDLRPEMLEAITEPFELPAPGTREARFASHAIQELRAAPSMPAGAPAHQIAMQVTRIVQHDVDRLKIQLHPEELGTVEISIESKPENGTKVVIAVDRPETLDLLRREWRHIEQILTANGLDASGDSLQLELRDQGDGSREDEDQQGRQSGDHGTGDVPSIPTTEVIASVSDRLFDLSI